MSTELLPSRFSGRAIAAYDAQTEPELLGDDALRANLETINTDMAWLATFWDKRMLESENDTPASFYMLAQAGLPAHHPALGPYAHVIHELQLSPDERIMLLLAIIRQYDPAWFTKRLEEHTEGTYISHAGIGGYLRGSNLQFAPTIQTVCFLVAGYDRFEWHRCMRDLILNSKLINKQYVSLQRFHVADGMVTDFNLIPDIEPEYVQFLLYGRAPRPDFGFDFPAHITTTSQEWEDLVLPFNTYREVEHIVRWVTHGEAYTNTTEGKSGKSFPVLFYGPPGTGKSLTAKLIGKKCNVPVFTVDISKVVSKYIGETEKNLGYLFDRLQGKRAVLLFDEADALFGKRTAISDSKDKWANMEMSYLLTRIETFDGLVVLTSNFKDNIDPAMTRRLQVITQFPRPTKEEREKLWRNAGLPNMPLPPDLDIPRVAKLNVTGANIANICKHSALAAISRGENIMNTHDMSYFINLEFAKENRTPDPI
ncbi:MAG: ATP-binding protein [Bacteroidia bacterium]